MAAVGNIRMEEPIIRTAPASTDHIEAVIAVNIGRIKAIITAHIALASDRIAITFNL